ncbi:twin transmembrane helix small protein [Lichenibacterium dinghuense]|uniref:twin transmembrane helix small protein n=1 Tax=Lichenibacterium dinghuense TaxID=2895977 RepID=UPI001F267832|nr:twin transmembrane helix small protein [Lichenibacterium sp. 6Y81]
MSAAAANSLILVAIGLVFAVLMAGLVNMVRGGSSNTSQRLMRWRVGLQFVAILVVMAVLYLRG